MRTLYHHRKYKGVYQRGNRFIAAITHDGKTHYIGSYANEVDAADAYDLEAKLLHRDRQPANAPDDAGERNERSG
jgi:hypothetical protein